MSIYRTRLKRPTDDDSHQAAGPDGERARAGLTLPVAARPERDWSRTRRATPANFLLPFSVTWLASLPEAARPVQTSIRYPRIVNRLALEWDDPAACRANFDELLYDHRGKRRGFPQDVHRELLALNEHRLSTQIAEGNGLALA